MRVFGTFKVRLWGPSPVGPALWSLRVPGRDGYVFTQPSSAGYRPVAKIGWQVRDLRTARTLACLLSLRPASSWPTLTSAARPSHWATSRCLPAVPPRWASSRRLPAGPPHGASPLGQVTAPPRWASSRRLLVRPRSRGGPWLGRGSRISGALHRGRAGRDKLGRLEITLRAHRGQNGAQRLSRNGP